MDDLLDQTKTGDRASDRTGFWSAESYEKNRPFLVKKTQIAV